MSKLNAESQHKLGRIKLETSGIARRMLKLGKKPT